MALEDAGKAWRRVDVDDALFTGSEMGGFMGLEELGPAPVISSDQRKPAHRRKTTTARAEQEADRPAKKRRTDGLASICSKQQPETDTQAEPAATSSTLPHTHTQQPAQRPARKKGKLRKQKQPQPPAEPTESTQPEADDQLEAVSKAWDFCGLHTKLLATLAAKGFLTPTPIQQRCLPSAIWNRKDIVGAAQTVRLFALFSVATCCR